MRRTLCARIWAPPRYPPLLSPFRHHGILHLCGNNKVHGDGKYHRLPRQLRISIPLRKRKLQIHHVTLGDYNNLSVSVAPASVDEEELEQLMESPNFWEEPEESQEIMKELTSR